MKKLKSVKDEQLKDILELLQEMEKIDPENNESSAFDIPVPYSSGKRPEPQRWSDQGLRYKRA